MPLIKLQQHPTRALAVWKIEEPEHILLAALPGTDEIPTAITHPQKRLEYAAGRAVVKELMALFNYPYQGIIKNEFGKPFLKNCPTHVSMSHSFPYVAIIVDAEKIVGIDIEQKKENLRRVAPRIFQPAELENCGNDLAKLCICWCTKESLVKVYGKKDLVFKEELFVEPFELKKEGKIIGQIKKSHHENSYSLQYLVEQDFVLVYTI